MKKLLLTLLNMFIITLVVTASSLFKYQSSDSLTLERRINIIHLKVVDLTNIFSLHHVKEFNEVYYQPLNYKGSVIAYLKTPANYENKVIAISMMTKLSFNSYIDILNSYYKLYTEKKINEQLLIRGVFNEFDTDYRLAKEYKNPLVRKLLSKILQSKSISPNFKILLRETLSGRYYHNLKRIRNL